MNAHERLSLHGARILPHTKPRGALSQDTPVSGGTLNMLVQPEPPSLMLGLNQLGPTHFAASKIYQSLLTYGPDLNPLPSLATWHGSATD